MAKPNITNEKRVCKDPDCGREYDAEIITALNVRLVRGNGFCSDCVKKMDERERQREKDVRERAIISQRRQWRLNCGIPPRFMNEDFSTFDRSKQETAFKVCWDYAEGYPFDKLRGYKSLLLFSEHSWGVGKTHLVCSIGHRVLDRWKGEDISRPVLFVSEPDLYTRLQASYGFSGNGKKESEADIIRQLTRVRLLILDDVGKRRVADPKFVQRIMFSIIDGRYREMLPMVITANLNPEELEAYLGGGQGDEAAVDRLVEMCGKTFWQVEGDSYRKKPKVKSGGQK